MLGASMKKGQQVPQVAAKGGVDEGVKTHSSTGQQIEDRMERMDKRIDDLHSS